MTLFGRIGLLLVSLALCAAVTEGLAHVSLRQADRYYIWPPGLAREQRPLPGLIPDHEGVSQFTINALGMRGDPFREEQRYRVVALGGSTTICALLDDSDAWPRVIQSRVNAQLDPHALWVGNVGRPGHGTWHHLEQMEQMLAQPPELDAILILVGANDMMISLNMQFGFGAPNRAAPPASAAPAAQPPRENWSGTFSVTPWKTNAPFYRLPGISEWLSRRLLLPRLRGNEIDRRGQMFVIRRGYRKAASRYRDSVPGRAADLGVYREQLLNLADIAERRGKRLIFITQPSLWRDDLTPAESDRLWMGGPPRGGAEFFSAGALASAMERYNRALLDVCRERDLECVDAASALPRDTSIHWDDIHFTVNGSHRLAEVVADHLLERGLP